MKKYSEKINTNKINVESSYFFIFSTNSPTSFDSIGQDKYLGKELPANTNPAYSACLRYNTRIVKSLMKAFKTLFSVK